MLLSRIRFLAEEAAAAAAAAEKERAEAAAKEAAAKEKAKKEEEAGDKEKVCAGVEPSPEAGIFVLRLAHGKSQFGGYQGSGCASVLLQ